MKHYSYYLFTCSKPNKTKFQNPRETPYLTVFRLYICNYFQYWLSQRQNIYPNYYVENNY